ncbi:MAG: diguanylate cyclase [Xanthomonadales bacterium]|nr:diguanylate cyclase [Xanthomonadales bacterium]MDL1868099.1 diguanylate cyclase [Gammaproteobacteria bacterium PRO6]
MNARARDWLHGWRHGLVMGSLLACLAVWLQAPCKAADIALQGQWRAAQSADAPAPADAAAAQWQSFAPGRFTRIAPAGGQAWIELRAQDGAWPAAPWVLSVFNAGLQQLTLHDAHGQVLAQAQLGRHEGRVWPGHGRVAFMFDGGPGPGATLLLHVDSRHVIAGALRFSAESAPDFLRSDARWLALASASLGIMLAMALIALVFAQRLRDVTFLHYAIFIAGYAFILALQSGYVFEPLGWWWLASAPRVWGRIAVATTLAAATLFFIHYADLARYAPRARSVLVAFSSFAVATALLGLLPFGRDLSASLINPLLILGGPLFLGIALHAARRGSFYAGLFMLGWTPLLAATVLGSAQLYGVTPDWIWSDEAAFGCGAIEAIVFSLALAYRTLDLRTAFEQAREQAEIDPLTGLYNRRGWANRVSRLPAASGALGPLALLFLDLDHFKQLNDSRGHQVGDAVLRGLADAIRGELRAGDLCGRYGGEEFVVALPGLDASGASELAQRLRLRVRRGLGVGAPDATISIGVAVRLPDESLPDLIRRADRAMYAAKQAGRDTVMLADTA